MQDFKVTHIKSEDCYVCQDMKKEISKLRKDCKDGKTCKVKVVDFDSLSSDVQHKLADKNGEVGVPITQIKKGDKVKQIPGFASSKEIKQVMEDWE